jgi:hypothetical protein
MGNDRDRLDRSSETLPASETDEGAQRRGSAWARVRAWFARDAVRRDSYVSNVTNPDDRRFIPRR